MQAIKNQQNQQLFFYCEECDYTCSRKFNWEQHILTLKHSKATNGLLKATEIYACDICDIIFKHKSSYYRHKKKCVIVKNDVKHEVNNDDTPLVYDKELVIMLIKQNTELLEIVKNGTNVNNSNNTNSLNKTFNLQFFLNETCKDAMNMTDFVNSIKFQLNDLEKMGDIGYVQGISNIITKNLKTLEVNQRPVHCTDQKRETIYIKDEDKWEKEDDNKTKLRKMIQRITNKNIKILPQFREKNPGYDNSALKISDTYDKLVLEVMGGAGNNDTEKENKIIHNISKCITINK